VIDRHSVRECASFHTGATRKKRLPAAVYPERVAANYAPALRYDPFQSLRIGRLAYQTSGKGPFPMSNVGWARFLPWNFKRKPIIGGR
jgi:hypothetical protein